MTRGRAVQIGSAEALFERPQHRFVGHFIGSPGMNVLPATLVEAGPETALVELTGGERLRCAVDARRAKPGDAVQFGVRPEHLQAGMSDNALGTRVTFVESLGSIDRKSTRLNSSHSQQSRMPSSA